ncbi:hypothetical protein CPB83DRAFT_899932 [Crepidotus variabilis]|uniref:Uncharacterized protein n=1 Tax=Crepidotus variabilis TaxID=179855 RepID=A0A9P6E413_9AGAR|nr:hypothetical protein CPB83DRAFT_899932 [Crepidotus variabilis]
MERTLVGEDELAGFHKAKREMDDSVVKLVPTLKSTCALYETCAHSAFHDNLHSTCHLPLFISSFISSSSTIAITSINIVIFQQDISIHKYSNTNLCECALNYRFGSRLGVGWGMHLREELWTHHTSCRLLNVSANTVAGGEPSYHSMFD